MIVSNAWAEFRLVKQNSNTVWVQIQLPDELFTLLVFVMKEHGIVSKSLPLPTGAFPMLPDDPKRIVRQANWGLSQGAGNRFSAHFLDYLSNT